MPKVVRKFYRDGVEYKIKFGPQPITESGIYWSADLGLISLSSNGATWITIADKNLGATTVYNDGDTLSEANCGKYYQWGNNYGFPWTGTSSTSSSQVNTSGYGPGNYYSSSVYRTRPSGVNDWSSVQNDNLWGGVTGTNEAMKGPCASGFHIPKDTERVDVVNAGVSLGAWTSSGGNDFRIKMKIPFAGNINLLGNLTNQGTEGYYGASIATGTTNARFMDITASRITPQNASYRYISTSIRPFANTPVQPTGARTKLN